MRTQRVPGIAIMAVLALAVTSFGQRAEPAERAGEVVRVVPAVSIERGIEARSAAPRAPVYWQDAVRTGRLARARLRLDDGSALNVGSDSRLVVARHDPVTDRTELELLYGKLRSRVIRGVRPGGAYRVRSPVAVAGVVGTSFWVGVIPEATEVICFEGEVTVRNADERVGGQVKLRPGEFTRVLPGQPPTPPVPAPPEKMREALEETDIAAGAISWTRAEVSLPPPGCGAGARLRVRAWARETREGRVGEWPVDRDLVAGTLRLGEKLLAVDDGVTAPVSENLSAADAAFTPAGQAAPVRAKVWEPLAMAAGEGWRGPRAVVEGEAFYVLGPAGAIGEPVLLFGAHGATVLWSAPCGAAFLTMGVPAGEHEVSLRSNGWVRARGKISVVRASYQLPTPPTVKRGQTAKFNVWLEGLAGLERHTKGRPVMVLTLANQTPAVLGKMKSGSRGGRASGQTVTFQVSGKSLDAWGRTRLAASAKGLQAGTFVLQATPRLDAALAEPRTPLESAQTAVAPRP